MALDQFLLSILFLLLTRYASSSFISDDALGSRGSSTGRSLLQAKKSCPVNFEFQNYTIITSQCKGPNYQREACCNSFKQFACPFVDELNDVTNDCATTMFSYINLAGHYPPGLFSSFCREGKLGLACPASGPSSAEDASANGGQMVQILSPLPIILAAGLLLYHII